MRLVAWQMFEDSKALRGPSVVLPSRFQKAAAGIALAACFVGVDVGVQSFARPSVPGQHVRSSDKIARQPRALVSEDSAVHALLIVHGPELSPDKESPGARGNKYELFPRPGNKIVVLVSLIEETHLGALDVVGIVTPEQIGRYKIAIFDHDPHRFSIASARARRQAPAVLANVQASAKTKTGLDFTVIPCDAAGMTYPGGKSGSGVYQRIINLMPPHRVYIEPFLGGGAIFRLKRPARENIGVEIDSAVFSEFAGTIPGSSAVGRNRQEWRTAPTSTIVPGDGIQFLRDYKFRGDELVYCDPPYLMATRSGGRLYRHEMGDLEHQRLLRCIRKIPALVMISGYWSQMYASALKDWTSTSFQAMTRGRLATEWLWFNFPVPTALHDYSYLGENFRERERIKRKKARWTAKLRNMPNLERQALLSAIEAFTLESGAGSSFDLVATPETATSDRASVSTPIPEIPEPAMLAAQPAKDTNANI
jgi:DNA adenine methylase